MWPDNARAVSVFLHLGGQWRSSGFGATGLDYNVLYHKLDRMHLSESEYDELEADVHTLEVAALKAMRKK